MSPLPARLPVLALGLLLVLVPTACRSDGRPAAASRTGFPSTVSTDPSAAVVEDAVEDAVFSPDSPWNTVVEDDPVAPDSAALLEQSLLRTRVGADGATQERAPSQVVLDVADGAVPVVAGGVPTVLTCRRTRCGDGVGDLTLPVPEGVDPDPTHDGTLTVLDPATRTGYDLGRARREADGSLSYYSLRRWDLDGPGFSRPYVAGVRGSGLPLFAGLLRTGELERCQVDHALALSVPGPAAGTFVQPASTSDGDNTAGAVPEGARLRLRADFLAQAPVDPVTGRTLPFGPTERAHADCIVEALQRYGAVVVGRAALPTLHVQRPPDDRPSPLSGTELLSLQLGDFEVLDLAAQPSYPYPPDDPTEDD